MILVIDNYDSFVHNLARHFRVLGCETLVVRNDAIDAERARRVGAQAIVLSPGPCTPNEAGATVQIVRELHEVTPILGVCLGHQAIGAALGASVERAPRPVHGREAVIEHDGHGVFADVANPLRVGRYHSLTVESGSLPDSLVPTAWGDDGVLMAMRHATLPVVGLQFHPESVLTEHGLTILANFLRLAGAAPALTTASPHL